MKQAEDATGVKSVYLLAGFVTFLFCFILYGLGASLVCDVIGIIYPAYMSYLTIEKKLVLYEKQWLSYWVIFGFIKLTDDTTNFFYEWIPLYSLLKLVLIIWLLYPTTRGAEKVFDKVIAPIFEKSQGFLDPLFEKMWMSVDSATAKMQTVAAKTGARVMEEQMKKTSTS